MCGQNTGQLTGFDASFDHPLRRAFGPFRSQRTPGSWGIAASAPSWQWHPRQHLCQCVRQGPLRVSPIALCSLQRSYQHRCPDMRSDQQSPVLVVVRFKASRGRYSHGKRHNLYTLKLWTRRIGFTFVSAMCAHGGAMRRSRSRIPGIASCSAYRCV